VARGREVCVSAREDLRSVVEALVPGLDRAVVAEHFARLDEEYFIVHTAGEIARHLALVAQTSPEEPAAVEIRPADDARSSEIVIVGYDYFGEFAILCGLLSASSLDIRSGRIYTYAPAQERSRERRPSERRGPRFRKAATASGTRIVDIFMVAPQEGSVFDSERRAQLGDEVRGLMRLVARGDLAQARDRVNQRLVERLEALKGRFAGVLLPVDVTFSDEASGSWTVMDVRGADTPAFLYALGNALSLREIYIHRVEIGTVGGLARDRFFIAKRAGGRIESAEERAALRLAVGLIKQFTHFLPSAPDPAHAIRAFDQLLDRVMEAGVARGGLAAFVEKDLDALAHLLGSSRFLWEDFLRMQCENLLPLLGSLKDDALPRGRATFERVLGDRLAAAPTLAQKRRSLNEYKDRTMFLIDMKQLLDPSVGLVDFSAALTDLAEAVVAQALAVCAADLVVRHGRPRLESGAPCASALFGLGKFGGRELGYASDVELLLAYGGAGRTDGAESIENAAYFDALARLLCELVEARRHGIFEIDLRLRPYGKKGALASSVDELALYYRAGGDAHPFERQALVKLRCVAGDESLGRRVETIRDAFVYGGLAWDRAAALHLRARQLRELVRPGEINVKLGPGGIVDIEYAVQYLQIQHGAEWPDVRNTNTLAALASLAAHGVVSAEEEETLRRAYLMLRRVVDVLRMVRGDAKDLMLPPEGSDEAKFLARRLGVEGETWAAAATALAHEVGRRMADARAFYVSRFGEPA
jgi:glutamate-ammonia-ligase adenylyltransferase